MWRCFFPFLLKWLPLENFSSFLSQSLFIFLSMILSSLSTFGYVTVSQMADVSIFRRSAVAPSLCLHSTWMSLPAVFLCCTFIVVNQFIFVIFSFSKNATWAYQWQKRRPQSYKLCCLSMNWCTDRLWEEWRQRHQWSWCLYVTHRVICGLQS